MFMSKTDMLINAIAILLVILWFAGYHGVYLYGCAVALTAVSFATAPKEVLTTAAYLVFKDGSPFKLFLLCSLVLGYLLFPFTMKLFLALLVVGALIGAYLYAKVV